MADLPKPVPYRGHLLLPAEDRVLAFMPHAKRIQQDGVEWVIVPHKLDETKVLRNLGYEAPPPILVQYDWCGDTPYDAQRITAAHITMNPRDHVLNGYGTGKTRSVLYAYDFLRGIGDVHKILVTAPLSTLRQTWSREVMTVFPHLRCRVLHGDKKKRLKLLAEDADVYIINHDGVEVILPELLARTDIDMLCLDELTAYKNKSTDRWKKTNALAKRMRRVVGMTGAPTPLEPLDAFGQVLMVNPTKVKDWSMTRFKEHTMNKITEFKWIPRKDAMEKVYAFMQPSVRFTRDECYDLPPCQTVQVACALTPDQDTLFRAMVRESAVAIGERKITAINEADEINKLLQVCLGAVYTTDGSLLHLDCKPRLEAVLQAVQESNSKIIVFSPYKASLPLMRDFLLKHGYSCGLVSGDVTLTQREQIFTQFMHSADPQVLLAHPTCMSHGLTLTAASTICWYGPPKSLEEFEQANARITRAGQKHSQLIVCIAATKVEERIYTRMSKRASLQGVLLDMYEQQELAEVLL
jgi:SNF2 family DNA or RNA helicase